MPNEKSAEFPRFCQKGSSGPGVEKLQRWLLEEGFENRIIPDSNYGEMTASGVIELQETCGSYVDGNFGPATQAVAKERYGFDFQAVCLEAGQTSFVQPDGEIIVWPPAQEEGAVA